MGRILLFEEGLQDTVNKLIGNQKTQVGLIIGQLSETKDFAIHLVRCPDPVDDEVEIEMSSSDDDVVVVKNSRKKSKKDSNSSSIETDGIDSKWIVEHARQVNRMLTGGMVVLGVYMFCPPDILSKNQTQLRLCLQAVQKKTERNKWILQSSPHNDRYVVHICASTRKITCQTVNFDEQTSLKPAEYRYQSFFSNWSSVSSCVDLNVHFHVPLSQEACRTEHKIIYACQREIEDIWNSYATTGYKLVNKDQLLVESGKTGKRKNDIAQDIKILLFKQINSSKRKEILKYDVANVQVKFVGSICAKAYLHSKATYGDAVKALKVDLIRSLLTRIELLCEEAEVNNLCHVDEWSLMSPARVFAPFKTSSINFCDYTFKDESEDDILGRFSELLNIQPTQEDLIYLERSPDVSEVSMILQGDKVVDRHSDVASELSNSCNEEPRDRKALAATVAGLAAVFAAVLHFIWRD